MTEKGFNVSQKLIYNDLKRPWSIYQVFKGSNTRARLANIVKQEGVL